MANRNGQLEFEPVDEWIIYEGQNLAVYVMANDPDNPYGASILLPDGTMDSVGPGAVLTWNHTALPEGAKFDPETMIFQWAPDYDQAGTYRIVFSATDDGDGTGAATTDQTELVIEVRDANAAPQIEEIANQSVHAGQTLVFDIAASDADIDTLTWSAEGLPSFAVLTDHGDNTATITAHPALTDRGNYTVTVFATDTGNGNPQAALTAQRQFILSAAALNAPPVITPVNHKVAVFDNELVFTVQVTDLVEDPLVFSAFDLPGSASFTPTSIYGQAEFRWTPTAADAGAHQITLQVHDSGNGDSSHILTDSIVVAIDVRPGNAAPILIPVGPKEIYEGDTLTFQVAGNDPDHDVLSFFADQLPGGAVLNEQTGEFVWKVGYHQAGYHNIAFVVSDGNRLSSEDVSITVHNTNRSPVFIPVPELTAHEGTMLQIQVAAGDPDGDAVTYYLAGTIPAGAAFDADTQTFVWRPGYDQAGVHSIRFAARDAGGLTDTFDAFIEVLNVNQAPVLAPLSGHVVPIGQTYITTIEADDPDAESILHFSARRLPAGAELHPNSGVLTWTPTAAQAGEHTIAITVSDGKLLTRQNLHLVVSPTPIPPDVRIEVTPSFPVSVGQSVLVHVGASGIADMDSIILLIDQQPVTLDSFHRAYYTPTTTGHVDIQAAATDIDGITGYGHADLKVRNPADTQAPVVVISSPAEGAILTNLTEITADITDSNLDWYRLELAPLGSDDFKLLAEGNEQVVHTDLAALDPDSLANGAYQVRLTAADIGGRSTTIRQTVEINTAAKPGSMQVTATDLTASLDGVPIEITRIYSTLNSAQSGAVGFGWNIAGFDAGITTNVPLTGWEHTGVYNPFTGQTRLYINLPDGQRVGYTFDPMSVEIGSQVFYRPAWTADPGVEYTLTTADAILDLVQDRFYQKGTGLAYNPAAGWFDGFAYTLTGPAGYQYSYDHAQNLKQVIGPDGQVVKVSDSGFVAANGDRVGFQWNPSGQLQNITAPDGYQVLFTYDDDGNLQSVINLNTGDTTWYSYDEVLEHFLTTVITSGAASRAIHYDAQGRLLSADPIDEVLGALSQFAGSAASGTIAPGQTDRYGMLVTEAELATSLTSSLILGLEITGSGGFTPAAAALGSLTPIYSSMSTDRSLAFYRIDSAGAYAVGIAGVDDAAWGDYQLDIFLPGDIDQNGRIDGVDENLFGTAGYEASSDINRDGDIDSVDRQFLNLNFAFVADQKPEVTAAAFETCRGIPITIDVSSLTVDTHSGALGYLFSNLQHGTIIQTGESHTILFAPDAGFAGTAGFDFQAHDGAFLSETAHVTMDITASALVGIQLAQRDLLLDRNQPRSLAVLGEFSDQQRIELPASLTHYVSTNPDVCLVTENGMLWPVSEGIATILVTAEGITAATPVTVGDPGIVPRVEFYPSSYTLTVGGTRQFVVREDQAAGPAQDRSAAADGTTYYLSNPAFGSITADGLFTGVATGTIDVTVIYGGQSAVVPMAVVSPQVGPTAMDHNGGIVGNADGYQISIPPDALPDGTRVEIATLTEADITMELPTGFDFAGAFSVDLSGEAPEVGLAISIPAPAGYQPGDVLWLFRPGKTFASDGSLIDSWELIDKMVVHPDGLSASTTSPPYPSVAFEDTYIITGTPVGAVGMAVTTTAALANRVAIASQYVIQVDPESGIGYHAVPGLFGDMYLPIAYPQATLTALRVTPQGLVRTETNIEIEPGQTYEYTLELEDPVAYDRLQPVIQKVQFAFDSTLGPSLQLTGSHFNPTPENNTVYIYQWADPEITGTVSYYLDAQRGSIAFLANKNIAYLPTPEPVTADSRVYLDYDGEFLYYFDADLSGGNIAVLDPVSGDRLDSESIPSGVIQFGGFTVGDETYFVLDTIQNKIYELVRRQYRISSFRGIASTISLEDTQFTGGLCYDSAAKKLWALTARKVEETDPATGDPVFHIVNEITRIDPFTGHTEAFPLASSDSTNIACTDGELLIWHENGVISKHSLQNGSLLEPSVSYSLGSTSLVPAALAAGSAPIEFVVQMPAHNDGSPIGAVMTVAIPNGANLPGYIVRVGSGRDHMVVAPGIDPAASLRWQLSDRIFFQLPPTYYVYVVNSGEDTVSVINPYLYVEPVPGTDPTGLIARLPVGKCPTDVEVTADGRYAFVTNTGEGTISIIDTITLTEIDLDSEIPGIQRIVTGNQPNYITLHPEKSIGFATDRISGNLFEFSTDISHLKEKNVNRYAQAHDVVQGAVPRLTGLTGIDVTADGNYLYIASPGQAPWWGSDDVFTPGYVFVYDIQQEGEYETIAIIPTGSKPFGVTAAPNTDDPYVAIAVRGSEKTGYTVINTDTQGIEFSLPANLRGYDPILPGAVAVNQSAGWYAQNQQVNASLFDIESAESIAFTRDGKIGFVLFNNTYSTYTGDIAGIAGDVLYADPLRDPNRGMGGNIGIILDPLNPDTKGFIAATIQVPYSWPDEITVGPFNKYLFASFKGTNEVLVYDIFEIRKGIEFLQRYNPEALTRNVNIGELASSKLPLEYYLEEAHFASASAAGTVDYLELYNPDELKRMGYDPGTAAGREAIRKEFEASLRGLGNILVTTIASGKMPSGIGSAPEAPTDLIVRNTKWIAGKDLGWTDANDLVIVEYEVLGKETTDPFKISLYRSFDETLDDSDIREFGPVLVDIEDAGTPGPHVYYFKVPHDSFDPVTGSSSLVRVDWESIDLVSVYSIDAEWNSDQAAIEDQEPVWMTEQEFIDQFTVPDPGLVNVTPDTVYNAGVVTVTIHAVSLSHDGVIELQSPGHEAIAAESITYTMQFPGGSPPGEVPQPAAQQSDDVWPWQVTIYATFDLTGVDAGLYDVRYYGTTWDGSTEEFILTGALEVAASSDPDAQGQVWSSVVLPDEIEPGETFTFRVQYGNDGQTNAPAPLLTVQVPAGVVWEIDGYPITSQTYTFFAAGLAGPGGSLMPDQVESMEFMASWDGSGNKPAIITWPTTAGELVAPEEMVTAYFNADPTQSPWNLVLDTLNAQFGTTYDSYLQGLQSIATRAATMGAYMRDYDQIIAFAVGDALQQVTASPLTADIPSILTYDSQPDGSAASTEEAHLGTHDDQGRWIPIKGVDYTNPVIQEECRQYAVTIRNGFYLWFGGRTEWAEWMDLWMSGAGGHWTAPVGSKMSDECLAWATSPANLPSTEKNENAPDRHQLSFVTYDLEKWLRTLDIPAGTTQVVTYTVNSSKSKLHLDFAGYYPGSTIPAPGRPIWAIGGCDGYIGYPQEPGSMERSFTVQVTRKELGAPGAVDDVIEYSAIVPIWTDDTMGYGDYLVNTNNPENKGDPAKLYIPLYLYETFGPARPFHWHIDMEWNVSGSVPMWGINAKAGPDQTITLEPDQDSVVVNLHGDVEGVDSSGIKPDNGTPPGWVWTSTSVDPADVRSPSVELTEGIYVFALTVTDVNGKYGTDYVKITVRPPDEDVLVIDLPEARADLFIVHIDDTNTIIEYNEDNNTGSFIIPTGMTLEAKYDGDSSPFAFGQYIEKVELLNTFTLRLDPGMEALTQSITAYLNGAAIEFEHTGTAWTTTLDMAGIRDGWVLQVQPVDGAGKALLNPQTYVFETIEIPDWLKVQPDTDVHIKWDNTAEAYQIYHATQMLNDDNARSIPWDMFVYYLTRTGTTAGNFIAFDFDLTGSVSNEHIGPYFSSYILGYQVDEISGGLDYSRNSAAQRIEPADLAGAWYAPYVYKAIHTYDNIFPTEGLTLVDAAVTYAFPFDSPPAGLPIDEELKLDSISSITYGKMYIDVELVFQYDTHIFEGVIPALGSTVDAAGTVTITGRSILSYDLKKDFNATYGYTLGGTVGMDHNLTISTDLSLSNESANSVTKYRGRLVGRQKLTQTATNNAHELIPAKLETDFRIDLSRQKGTGNPWVSIWNSQDFFHADDLFFRQSWEWLISPRLRQDQDTLDDAIAPMDLGTLQGHYENTSLVIADPQDEHWFQFRMIDQGRENDKIDVSFGALDANLTVTLFSADFNRTAETLRDDGLRTVSLADRPAGLYYLRIAGDADDTNVGYHLSIDSPQTDRPDLIAELDLGASHIYLDQPFTAEVTIRNVGSADAGATEARLVWSRDSLADWNDANLVPIIHIPPLAAGAAYQQTITVLLPDALSGHIVLAMEADRRNQIDESSETDNVAVKPVQIELLPDPYENNNSPATAVDLGLLLADRTVANLNLADPKDVDFFTLTLVETGTAADSLTVFHSHPSGHVGLYLYDPDHQVAASNDTSSLGSGRDTLSLAGILPGTYNVEIAPLDDQTVVYNLQITSESRSVGELSVDQLQLPQSLYPQQSATAYVMADNLGNRTARNITVELFLERNQVLESLAAPVVVPVLAGGEQLAVPIDFMVPADLTLQTHYPFYARVTASPGEEEIDYNNNQMTRQVLISGLPDAFESEQSLLGYADLGAMRGSQTINNLSLHSYLDKDLFRFRLIDTPQPTDQILVGFSPADGNRDVCLFYNNLKVAESISLDDNEIIHLDGLAAGEYFLMIVSDGTPVDNYSLTFTAPDTAGANLVVDHITIDQSVLSSGASLNIAAEITNVGDTDAAGFTAQYALSADRIFDPAGDILLGDPVSIPSLMTAASWQDSRSLTLPAGLPAGSCYLYLVLDTEDSVPETAENDNLAYTTLAVWPALDSAEPNNNSAQAAPVHLIDGSYSQSGLTISADDKDYYSFCLDHTGGAADQIRVLFNSAQGPLNLTLLDHLARPLQTAIRNADELTLSLAALPQGHYFIQVAPQFTDTYSSSYKLDISTQPNPPAHLTIPTNDGSDLPPSTVPVVVPVLPDIHAGLNGLMTDVVNQLGQTALDLWQTVLALPLAPDIVFSIENLACGTLARAGITQYAANGLPQRGIITIDDNANGRGWFVDQSPLDNSEFTVLIAADGYQASAVSPASGTYDLFTVLLHEVGHVLGFTDAFAGFASYIEIDDTGTPAFVAPGLNVQLTGDRDHITGIAAPADLMNPTLKQSIRKLPSALDAMMLNLALDLTPASAGQYAANLTVSTSSEFIALDIDPTSSTDLPDENDPENTPEIITQDNSDGTMIVNGDFNVADPSAPGFGWSLSGAAYIDQQSGMMPEADDYYTGFSQSVSIPANGNLLRFTIVSINWDSNLDMPPDAFQVALLNADDNTSWVDPMANFSESDAFINLQPDGRIYFAPQLYLLDYPDLISGAAVTLDTPLVVTLDISGIPADTVATLCFDLVSFAGGNTQIVIDDVEILASDILPPIVIVDTLRTADNTPSLTGTINDPDAEISVTVAASTYAAINNGDGTWMLPDDTITTALDDGIYDVAVSATDLAGNTGYDITTDELEIDTTGPLVTVDERETRDSTPPLTGTVDDPDAEISVTVAGSTYAAINNGDGTWMLPDDTISPDLLPGIYNVEVLAVDTLGNTGADDSTDELTIVPQTGHPSVENLLINEGQAQRSMLRTLSVTFDQPMNLDALIADGTIADSVKLYDKNDMATFLPWLDNARFAYDPSSYRLTMDLTIDGFGGSELTHLADGRYEIRFNTELIRDLAGNRLLDTDGREDGWFTLDRSVINGLANPSQDLFRYFGDSDGDADVDFVDQLAFRKTQFKIYPDPAYNHIFDADDDGDVDFTDMFKVRKNFESGPLPQ